MKDHYTAFRGMAAILCLCLVLTLGVTAASADTPETASGQLDQPTITNVTHGSTVGCEVSAHITVPDGAAWVYVVFGLVDEEGNFLNEGAWAEIYPGDSGIFSVLGLSTQEAGPYQLCAQARKNDTWEESPSDSEWAVYEFTLADAALQDITDLVTFSKTENISYGDTVTFTVQGAEAVVCQLSAADGSWGTGMPNSATQGDTDTLRFGEEAGQTAVTIWGRFGGLWSRQYQTTIDVQGLGDIESPSLRCYYNKVSSRLTIPVGTALTFRAEIPEGDSIYYELNRQTGEGEYYDYVDSDSLAGTDATFTLDADLVPAGSYMLEVSGYRQGWTSQKTRVLLEVREDTPFVVTDGTIVRYTGDPAVTSLVIPSAVGEQTVTAIGDFVFDGYSQLSQVTFPDGLKALGDGAFMNCPLTSVLVAEGTDTKDWVFYEADFSTDARTPFAYHVALPATVTRASAPFLGCSTLPRMTPDFVTPGELTTIDTEAFAGTSPTFVWLTDNVTEIAENAFAGCNGLLYVRVPAGCRSIGEGSLPEGVTLLVEWGSEAETYANENGNPCILLVEGFNG